MDFGRATGQNAGFYGPRRKYVPTPQVRPILACSNIRVPAPGRNRPIEPEVVMKRSIFALLLIALIAGCSSAPRTVLRMETNPLLEVAPTDGGIELADGDLPAQALLERPHGRAIWVKGEYYHTGGRYLWVPGHWRDTRDIAR
jgi:hypothetical protein